MLESCGPKRRLYNIKKGHTILETTTKLLEQVHLLLELELYHDGLTGSPEEGLLPMTGSPVEGLLGCPNLRN